MAAERWIFTKEQISASPSRPGYSDEKELAYRQQAASLIQNMGQKLNVNQLCICTSVVYMHRFYMYQSFQRFSWRKMSAACLFLAAKVEEQPRKLEHVIKVAHHILNRKEDGSAPPPLDVKTPEYLERVHELVINENILLQVLGFNVTIDHSNAHVLRHCQLIKAPKDLTGAAYALSTNSLLGTTMCLQYKSQIIAAACIHSACKLSNWEIPQSREGKHWWQYLEPSLTSLKLDTVTEQLMNALEKADPVIKWKKQLTEKLKGVGSPSSAMSSPAASPSQNYTSSSSRNDKPVSSTSISSRPAMSYAEHRERNKTDTSRSRPHAESPLVSGDRKRPHPTESSAHHHHKSSHSHTSSSDRESYRKPPNTVPDPYNVPRPISPAVSKIQPQSNSNNDRHYHHQPVHSDSSPMKRMKYGNGSEMKTQPPLPPLPQSIDKPPLPP